MQICTKNMQMCLLCLTISGYNLQRTIYHDNVQRDWLFACDVISTFLRVIRFVFNHVHGFPGTFILFLADDFTVIQQDSSKSLDDFSKGKRNKSSPKIDEEDAGIERDFHLIADATISTLNRDNEPSIWSIGTDTVGYLELERDITLTSSKEKGSDELLYIRFGHSLWSANQLPAQEVKTINKTNDKYINVITTIVMITIRIYSEIKIHPSKITKLALNPELIINGSVCSLAFHLDLFERSLEFSNWQFPIYHELFISFEKHSEEHGNERRVVASGKARRVLRWSILKEPFFCQNTYYWSVLLLKRSVFAKSIVPYFGTDTARLLKSRKLDATEQLFAVNEFDEIDGQKSYTTSFEELNLQDHNGSKVEVDGRINQLYQMEIW
ncbi:hypothetical protein WN51_12554 [Melipona quadrifasciata]|uniref:Uncharacterized protein n=1 Tax=Melipona quadrifasciata TaxID=166423 RepID=A0A0M9A3M1_9HYME|nr:hypothetical protein WN51_12554 [Melipona quadrifasciata]